MPVGSKYDAMPPEKDTGGVDKTFTDFKSYLRDRAQKPRKRTADMNNPTRAPAPEYDVPGYQTAADGWRGMADQMIGKMGDTLSASMDKYMAAVDAWKQGLKDWILAGQQGARPAFPMPGQYGLGGQGMTGAATMGGTAIGQQTHMMPNGQVMAGPPMGGTTPGQQTAAPPPPTRGGMVGTASRSVARPAAGSRPTAPAPAPATSGPGRFPNSQTNAGGMVPQPGQRRALGKTNPRNRGGMAPQR